MTIHLHSARATIRELLEARIIMEPLVARLAAARLTPESEIAIRDAVKVGWDALPLSSDEWSGSAEHFHSSVAKASGNRVVDLFSASLVSIHRARVGSTFPEQERQATCQVHQRIAEAIVAGDSERAEQLMHRHLTELVAAIQAWMPNQMDELVDWR
jgi:DNA-binding FadR family transcriptional regulator